MVKSAISAVVCVRQVSIELNPDLPSNLVRQFLWSRLVAYQSNPVDLDVSLSIFQSIRHLSIFALLVGIYTLDISIPMCLPNTPTRKETTYTNNGNNDLDATTYLPTYL